MKKQYAFNGEKTMERNPLRQQALANPLSQWALNERLESALLLFPKKAKKVLDFGCGEGHFIGRLQTSMPHAEFFGIDASNENVLFCRRKWKGTFETCSHIPEKFSQNPVDVITLLEILDHLEDPAKVLKQAHDALTPDGMIIVSVPDTASLKWNVIWGVWTNTFGRIWKHAHIQRFNERTLTRLLEEKKFTILEKKRALFNCIMIFKCVKHIP